MTQGWHSPLPRTPGRAGTALRSLPPRKHHPTGKGLSGGGKEPAGAARLHLPARGRLRELPDLPGQGFLLPVSPWHDWEVSPSELR